MSDSPEATPAKGNSGQEEFVADSGEDEEDLRAHEFRVDPRMPRQLFRRTSARTLRWLGGLVPVAALLLAAVFAVWFVIEWVPPRLAPGPPSRARSIELQSIRAALLQALGGLALLGGLYYTARNLRSSREAQITDRYSRAISQLGDENQSIRIGAILALERISRDSPIDYLPVLHLLVSYLREHASLRSTSYEGLPADLQAVIAVLARRSHIRLEDLRLDLSHLRLPNADFVFGNMSHVDFTHSEMPRSFFREANLKEAIFFGTSVPSSTFVMADMREAFLPQADLSGCFFRGARLDEANFTEANLTQAHLDAVYEPDGRIRLPAPSLEGAGLEDANLTGAVLSGADLRSVEGLTEEQLKGAILDARVLLPPRLAHMRPSTSPNG
jgi:uncharacterized protein YjbI with pentapeptide repeats